MAETPQRRGQAVLDNVLESTLALLAEHSHAFSIDDVARRADVHKTTIYRRWPTKSQLIGAAVARLAAKEIVAVRTDDPIADLTRLALDVGRTLRTGAAVGALRAILAAASDDAEIAPIAREFLTGRYQIAVGILNDAAALGIVREDLDAVIIWEAIVNPLHVRAMLGMPASDDTVQQLVTLALEGAGVR